MAVRSFRCDWFQVSPRGDGHESGNTVSTTYDLRVEPACYQSLQVIVIADLKHIRQALPFPLLGIDSDNGSEFINDELARDCDQAQLTFTRGRVGRKNDNP